MLKIKNYKKIEFQNIGKDAFIERVEEMVGHYSIDITSDEDNTGSWKTISIYLERNPIGDEYELWCWSATKQIPIRRLLKMDSIDKVGAVVYHLDDVYKEYKIS